MVLIYLWLLWQKSGFRFFAFHVPLTTRFSFVVLGEGGMFDDLCGTNIFKGQRRAEIVDLIVGSTKYMQLALVNIKL